MIGVVACTVLRGQTIAAGLDFADPADVATQPAASTVPETLPDAPVREPDTQPRPMPSVPDQKPDLEPFNPPWPAGRPEPQPKAWLRVVSELDFTADVLPR